MSATVPASVTTLRRIRSFSASVFARCSAPTRAARMSPSSWPIAPAIAALCSAETCAPPLRVSANPSAAPPTTSSAPPSASARLPTLAPELVGLRTGRRIGRDADVDLVLAGLDRDVALDRRLAAHAPRAELVLAGRDAAERELAAAVGDDVRRRGDHRDVRAHV